MKKILALLIICCSFNIYAAVDQQHYCDLLHQIHPGMQIKDVFLILGPPHTFGQPPNLDMAAMYNKSTTVAQPQASLGNTASEKDLMMSIIDSDPILQAFINASPNTTNVLIWQYEGNKLNISVKTKGSIVLDVNGNFKC